MGGAGAPTATSRGGTGGRPICPGRYAMVFFGTFDGSATGGATGGTMASGMYAMVLGRGRFGGSAEGADGTSATGARMYPRRRWGSSTLTRPSGATVQLPPMGIVSGSPMRPRAILNA